MASMYEYLLRHSRTLSDTHRYGAHLAALVFLMFPAWVVRADEIYKTVDADGHAVYSNRAGTSTAQMPAEPIDEAKAPPNVVHFCWTNCFTLRFDHGVYRRTDGSDETWSVERFTSTSVMLRRHGVPEAWNGFSADVTYQGEVSNDRLINVAVNGNPVPDINMAWGAALDTLPGSNAERDQRNAEQMRPESIPVSAPPPTDMAPGVDVEMSAAEAPPPLLNDEQPPCAQDGSLWTPGYWAWGGGYYWVPGVWVLPPRVGVLWTPGYWAFSGTVYAFHPGYWGPHIGFYGGINYGFGYGGAGFAGGRWVGNSFAYNRTVNNLDTSVIHNTYHEAVVNNVTPHKVSFNGGPGGISAAATAQERAAAAEPHFPPTPLQRQVSRQAASVQALVTHPVGGHPAPAVTHKSTVSSASRAVGAHGTVAPPAHVTPALTVKDQPNLTQVAPNAAAHSQGAAAQPATSKPANATPTKPPQHPKH
jgi:hypothetical protein